MKKLLPLKQKDAFRNYISMALFLAISVLFFLISCTIFLSIAHLMHYGLSSSSRGGLYDFYRLIIRNPFEILSAYYEWMQVFYLSIKYNSLTLIVFIPLLATILPFLIISLVFFKSSYSLSIWYRFSNHFAEKDEIEKMGLFDGTFLNLGRFEDKILRLKQCFSVFCIGQIGSGKTSSVAIPSILDSDKSCIFAVDDNGSLAKFTSGYRSKLGNVFYFNWDLMDVPEKSEYWPRWNPLSDKDIPPKGKNRDIYLAKLAKCLLEHSDDNFNESYWDRLSDISLEGLLHFFVSKMEQAYANDYFLSKIIDKSHLTNEDKDILLSYYALMPKDYATEAIKNLEHGKLNLDNYLPIGSWQGIAKDWRGKELSLPMIADNIIQRYFMAKQNSENDGNDGWKFMLDNFLAEAQFFGYHHRSIKVLQHLSYLSKKQRSIVASVIIKPMSVFRNPSIRERTSLSDFNLSQSRGIKRANSDDWDVVTIYCSAGSRTSQFMSRLMMEMLISNNISNQTSRGPFPILFVLDNFERIPKINSLVSGLTSGTYVKMSFLLLTSDLKELQRVYGTEDVESIVSNASYKLIIAESNSKLSQHFSDLAIYGTKSIQMQPAETSKFVKSKFGLADSNYYNKIAKDLMSKNRSEMVKKGYLLLLAPTYYHLPIKAKAMFFLKHENLLEKATMSTAYYLNDKIEKCRNVQDVDVPLLLNVIKEAGFAIDSEEEIDKYLNDEYNNVIDKIQNFSDTKTVLADDISSKWKSKVRVEETKKSDNALEAASKGNQEDDWWMIEDSFASTDNETKNPFENK